MQLIQTLIEALKGNHLRDVSGGIFSWHNPKKQGYLYDEATGYAIKLFSYLYWQNQDLQALSSAIAAADYLKKRVTIFGGYSREGIMYTFDTGICISGLLALKQILNSNQYDDLIKTNSNFLMTSLKNKVAAYVSNTPLVNSQKWSLSYSAHLIKMLIPLYELYQIEKSKNYLDLITQITQDLINPLFKNGSFSINASNTSVYTHAHCYATEGMLFLNSKGFDFKQSIAESANWLANMQNKDGSLFNWYNCANGPQEKVGDACAQAIRIWLATDKNKFEQNIEMGIDFLKSLNSNLGGLRYSLESEDINSWVTMFALNAMLWKNSGVNMDWII